MNNKKINLKKLGLFALSTSTIVSMFQVVPFASAPKDIDEIQESAPKDINEIRAKTIEHLLDKFRSAPKDINEIRVKTIEHLLDQFRELKKVMENLWNEHKDKIINDATMCEDTRDIYYETYVTLPKFIDSLTDSIEELESQLKLYNSLTDSIEELESQLKLYK